MSTVVPGIKVETSVTIDDPGALGFAVADLDSVEQAQFLAGLANGFDAFPRFGSMHMQVRYLTEDAKRLNAGDRRAILEFVETLASHIAELTP